MRPVPLALADLRSVREEWEKDQVDLVAVRIKCAVVFSLGSDIWGRPKAGRHTKARHVPQGVGIIGLGTWFGLGEAFRDARASGRHSRTRLRSSAP